MAVLASTKQQSRFVTIQGFRFLLIFHAATWLSADC